MALGRRVVSDAARTEPPLGLGASSGIRRDECDHNPRLAWSRKPVRQVAKSHYSKAWEPGQVIRVLEIQYACTGRAGPPPLEHALHHVRPARRGLEPLITFCLARAQTVAIYAVL